MRRALVAAAALALIALAWLLWPRARTGPAAPSAPGAESVAPEPSGPSVRLNRPLPPTVSAGRRPKSEMPPPPENAPPLKPQGPQPVTLRPGELPLTPPAFANPEERTAFRKWWMQELERRIAVYQKLEPGHPFPTQEEAAHLIGEFYDAAEARRPGESADEASARADQLFERLNDFIAAFGAPPQTVSTRAGDPQYGTPLPPPPHVAVREDNGAPPPDEWPNRVPASSLNLKK